MKIIVGRVVKLNNQDMLDGIMNMVHDRISNKCPFCKIIENDSSKCVLNGNKNYVVINSKYPVTPRGHLLVIPCDHIEELDFHKLTNYSDYINWINYGIEVLRERGFNDFNVGWNLGENAGQTIEHQHCHIIGRKKNDVINPRGGIRNVIPEKGEYNIET